MYTLLSEKYNNSNWDYLNITNEIIDSRYGWVNISLPNTDRKFPWAHEYDMIKLFLVSRTFLSKVEAQNWLERNLTTSLLPVHISLLKVFCYSELEITQSIDELIDNSDNSELLDFIEIVLERSLLWNDPDPCWPGDFKRRVRITNEKRNNLSFLRLTKVDNPKIQGADFVSVADYTHVFYKFENLINGIEKGELYYSIKDLAKQVHDALLKSIILFFEYRISSLEDAEWERKLNQISIKETGWCRSQLINVRRKNKHNIV